MLYLFLIAFFVRAALAVYTHGFFHMDEHWQVIEPASGFLGFEWDKTYEWTGGHRSPIYPYVISRPLLLAQTLGITNPLYQVTCVRLIQAFLHSLMAPAIYRIVQQLQAQSASVNAPTRNNRSAFIIALLATLWPYGLFTSVHLHNEMFALPFLFFGALAYSQKRGWLMALGTGFFGFAALIKIDTALYSFLYIFIYNILNVYKLKKRLTITVSIGLLFFITLGAADFWYWGTWFKSVATHFHYNIASGEAHPWGTSPWYYHVIYWIDLCSIALLAAAAADVYGRYFSTKQVRQPATTDTPSHELHHFVYAGALTSLLTVTIYCLIPHKEKRFLVPALYPSIIYIIYIFYNIYNYKFFSQIKIILIAALTAHATHNIVHYLIKRPNYARIQAMQAIPAISPNTQTVVAYFSVPKFYLPKTLRLLAPTDFDTLFTQLRSQTTFVILAEWDDAVFFENALNERTSKTNTPHYSCPARAEFQPNPLKKESTFVPRIFVCERPSAGPAAQ